MIRARMLVASQHLNSVPSTKYCQLGADGRIGITQWEFEYLVDPQLELASRYRSAQPNAS